VEELRGKLAEFREAEAEYARLLEEKERLLAQAGDPRAERLLALSEQAADLRSEQKELKEAMEAGEAARSALQEVQSDLQSASNWGTWDMIGGGAFVTWAKHSKIDDARHSAHKAQRHLHRFREELADADQRLHASLDIGGFSTFADYFFDGLIADWVVQSKIQNASSACSSALDQVSAALSKCQRRSWWHCPSETRR
jgi:type II secretory pathway pseudopilin PulG